MKNKGKFKEILKKFMVLKVFLTIYLLVILLIVPEIDSIDAEKTFGAHRGASLDYEENTMDAFEKALNEEKYKFIEFDIQYTKDGEIVVFHQNNRFRFKKTSESISDLTYDKLNSEFEFDIPKYSEVMNLLAGNKPLEIEIKSQGDFEQNKKLIDFVVKDIKEKGIDNQVMIASVSTDVIAYLEEKYPEIKSGKIYWITFESITPILSISGRVYDTPADYVLLHGYNLYNYKTLIKFKPEDKGLVFWYFTDEVYIINNEGNNEFWG